MPVIGTELIPKEAIGLRLHRIIKKGVHTSCELVTFPKGYDDLEMVLRRAAISGRVEVNGDLPEDGDAHFADIYTDQDSWEITVALDANSYRALKENWLRCKLEKAA